MAGNSTISITYKFKGDNSGLKSLVSDVERLQEAFSHGFEASDKLKSSLINWNQVSQSLADIGQSVTALNNVFQDLSQSYAVQIESEVKLETVMRQRMSANDEMVQGVKDLCTAQQELGIIGDEVQLAGAQQLATFLSEADALKTLIPAMNNLAAQQKGFNATSSDMIAIGNMMGKVMQGQVTALRRVGISFSEAEEAALKNGTEQERAAMLAQIITNNVGEMNAKLAATDAGKQKQMANALSDMKEQLGGIVSGIAPYVSFSASIISTAANASRAATSFKALGAAVFGANGMFKSINTTLVASITGMNAASVATRALTAAVRALVAATVVGAAIEGLIWLFGKLTQTTDKATESVKALSLEEQSATAIADAETEARKRSVSQLEADIAKLKSFKGSKKEEQKIVQELNSTYSSTMGYFRSVAEWYEALTRNSKAYTEQMVNEAKARRLANQIADLDFKEQEARGNANMTRSLTLGGVKAGDSPLSESWDKMADNYKKNAEKLRSELNSITSQTITMPKVGSSSDPFSGTSKSSGTTAKPKELDALEKIEQQIKANEKAALTANDSELESLRKNTLELVRQRDALEAKQKALTKPAEYTPPQLEEIKTYNELERALSYWNEKFNAAHEDERNSIHKTIESLKTLRESWDKAYETPVKKVTELDERISSLVESATPKLKSMVSPLANVSLSSLIADMRTIDGILSGFDGDITKEQRESLIAARAEMQKYAKTALKSVDTFTSLWGNIKSINSAITGLTDAMKGNGTAWEKIISFVDAFISIYQGVKSVIDLINMMTAVTQTFTAAKQIETSTTVGGATAEIAANTAKAASAGAATTANVAEAASGVMKAHSSIPWVGIALGIAGVAAIIATMASLPKYAEGGLAFGPTVGMFGEYAGASNNPEVVAPLNKLKEYIGDGTGEGKELTCAISMNELRFYLKRNDRKHSRI